MFVSVLRCGAPREIRKWGDIMKHTLLNTATVLNRNLTALLLSGGYMGLTLVTAQTAHAVDSNGLITFEDIYQNPDDQDLNLAYARQQAKAGNLSTAAAALERMLFAQPNWDSARLFYALTLYQLDDRQAAIRELNLLEGRPLTPAQRRQLNRYQDSFDGERESATPRFEGRVAIGARYDDNAGNAIGDVVFGGRDKGDISATLQAVGRYSLPLSDTGNSRIYIRGDAQVRRHETVSDADFDIYGLEAGLEGRIGALKISAGPELLTVNVSGESYLDQIGGFAALSGAISENIIWSLRGEYADQDFKELNFTTNEANRSGDKVVLDAGLEFTPTDSVLLVFNLAYEDKDAIDDSLAYDGFRARAQAVYAFNADSYIRASGEYRDIKYDGDSIFLFPAEPRADENFKGRLATGIKANRLFAGIGIGPSRILEPVTFEIAGNYIERKTNIPGSGFDNLGAEFKILLDF